MSGGHFDYLDMRIVNDIIPRIDHDIEYNDISWEEAYKNSREGFPENYGFGLPEEALFFLRRMRKELIALGDLLHSYDWAISGNTTIEDFVKDARRIYGEGDPNEDLNYD